MARTFAGHRGIFDTCFGVALEAFLDWRDTHLTFILDDESPADHAWGAELELRFAGRSFRVVYAAPRAASDPASTLHLLTGFHFHGGRYGTASYHRMLVDTFYLDEYLPDARADDVVAICDLDAPFTSMLPTAEALLMPTLRQQAKSVDYFALDGAILAGTVDATAWPRLLGMMDLQYLP